MANLPCQHTYHVSYIMSLHLFLQSCVAGDNIFYHEACRVFFIRPDLLVLISWVWLYFLTVVLVVQVPTDPSGLYANASLTSCITDSHPNESKNKSRLNKQPSFCTRIHFHFDILFEVYYYHTLKRYMKPYPFFSDTQTNKNSIFNLLDIEVWCNGSSVVLLPKSPRFDTRCGYIFGLA